MKKIFAVLFALTLILSLSTAVFTTASADEETQTGSIIIEGTTTVPVAGKTFNAYKILDAKAIDANSPAEGIVYSIPAELQAFYNELCKKDAATIEDVMAYLKADDVDLHDFAVTALDKAKLANVAPVASVVGANDTAVIEDLPFGYYVIEDTSNDTAVSALMLQTTTQTVVVKADKPSIEKKIDGANDSDGTTTGPVDYNTAKVGEDVPYILTSKVPVMEGYASYTYVVTDTLSAGLTYNNDIVITIGNDTLVADDDYTVETNDQNIITITFKNFINRTAGDEIKITYSAKVNANAVFGTAGNPNTVVLTYSNNPQDDDSTKDTTPDTVYTYLANLVIFKTDSSNPAVPLAGAVFEIRNANGDTLADGTSVADTGLVTFTWDNGAALKDGESYTIVETKAPTGYNEAAPITFVVTCTDPTAPATACAWTASDNKVVYQNDRFEVTIANSTGDLLPETGGIGTTIFYVVGGLMMIVAFVLLVSKKRMGNYA